MSTDDSGDLRACYASCRETGLVARLLELARDEDLGSARRDVTSAEFVDARAQLRCSVVARTPAVVAGLAAIPDLLSIFGVDRAVTVRLDAADGATVGSGDAVANLDGDARSILAIERTLLNLVGRLSGVATLTSRYIDAMGTGHRAQLYDTRKTTPGLRVLEKYAVRCGGGRSHRLGLHDAMLVKDNHIAGVPAEALAHTVADAARRARAAGVAFVEVEVDSPDQFARLLALPAGTIDVVLLDNFPLPALREAVRTRAATRPDLLLEASGGVTLGTIRAVAETSVDRISVGALTHSAVSLDFGLDAV
jgi:nicotinate-nucleotide pyrophosphorylase (carboxylating)